MSKQYKRPDVLFMTIKDSDKSEQIDIIKDAVREYAQQTGIVLKETTFEVTKDKPIQDQQITTFSSEDGNE